MTKPNCFACKFRRNIPGDAHSSCVHPATKNNGDMFSGIIAMIAGMQADRPPEGARELEIKANAHGIAQGWFMWPYNYDPTWLEACKGFTARAQPAVAPQVQAATAVSGANAAAEAL